MDPNNAENDAIRPNAVLERVSVDGQEYPVGKALSLPPSKGRLEFQFTAPSFLVPEKLKFRYMLEGFDKDWIESGTRRAAYYTNIPHGEYRFHVQVGLGAKWGAQSDTPLITLAPHFYETKEFFICVALGVISLCVLAYRIRMEQLAIREQKLIELVDERTSALRESEAKLRQSRDELDLRVQEKTRELTFANKALGEEIEIRRQTEEQLILAKEAAEAGSRAKSDFLANMSHEIRTPINGILGMTEVTLATELDSEQREYLEIVKYSADSLLSIINDILDFSKIEARKLTMDHTQFRIRNCVGELVRSLQMRARQKGLTLGCEVADAIPDNLMGDPFRIRQVLLNLLDNAQQYGLLCMVYLVSFVLLTYSLLHANLSHIGFNVLWLLPFGSALARRFGAIRFFVFMAVTAVAGALAHLVTHEHAVAPMIGASASVSGAMAAAIRFAFVKGSFLSFSRGDAITAARVPALSLWRALRNTRVLAFLPSGSGSISSSALDRSRSEPTVPALPGRRILAGFSPAFCCFRCSIRFRA